MCKCCVACAYGLEVCVCVCTCMNEKESEYERLRVCEREKESESVCVCVWMESIQKGVLFLFCVQLWAGSGSALIGVRRAFGNYSDFYGASLSTCYFNLSPPSFSFSLSSMLQVPPPQHIPLFFILFLAFASEDIIKLSFHHARQPAAQNGKQQKMWNSKQIKFQFFGEKTKHKTRRRSRKDLSGEDKDLIL